MITKDALIWLSRQEGLKDFATNFKFFKKLTTRFVAGDTIDEVIPIIHEINAENATASFDHLNESVENATEAEREVEEYLSILAKIDEQRVRSKVTQVTIDIFKRLRAEFGLNDVGIVLQSYLYRTYADAQELVKLPARIRICKGAYNEPPEVAFPEKKDVDANYIKVMQVLLSSGIYHGIATHDPKMIDATLDFAKREGIGKEKYEFQMLYGIRRDLQRQLARDGFNVRIYVPYGKHWYPYFMRRLAERPANVWFVLRNLAKG